MALAHLDDEDAMVAAARTISELTHYEADAGDAVVLWCCAIRHAVLSTDIDVRIGLRHIDPERREIWISRIEEAEACRPADIPKNGWVVAALQAAWSAIVGTAGSPNHLAAGVDAAVRAGFDTDTVAAIAVGLLGAAYGASAAPLEWRGAVAWVAKHASKLISRLLAAFFVVIFPGNIAQYLEHTDAFGLNSDQARLIRLFFQPVLVAAALYAGGPQRDRSPS